MTAARIDRDAVIVAALATGATHAEAGKAAGCSTRTVARRLTEPSIAAAVDAERTRLAQEVADALAGRARAAVDRLAAVVAEGSDRDAVTAARVVLDQAVRHRDHVYVADRLVALEAALTRRESPSPWPAETA